MRNGGDHGNTAIEESSAMEVKVAGKEVEMEAEMEAERGTEIDEEIEVGMLKGTVDDETARGTIEIEMIGTGDETSGRKEMTADEEIIETDGALTRTVSGPTTVHVIVTMTTVITRAESSVMRNPVRL